MKGHGIGKRKAKACDQKRSNHKNQKVERGNEWLYAQNVQHYSKKDNKIVTKRKDKRANFHGGQGHWPGAVNGGLKGAAEDELSKLKEEYRFPSP